MQQFYTDLLSASDLMVPTINLTLVLNSYGIYAGSFMPNLPSHTYILLGCWQIRCIKMDIGQKCSFCGGHV